MRNTKTKARKTTQIGIRLDDATRRQLDAVAARDRRTVSDYVRLVLERHLRRKRVA